MNGTPTGNRLINSLDQDDRDALLVNSTLVDYAPGHVFYEPGDLIEHVCFIESGIISSVAALQDGRTVETLMIGCEGITGVVAAIVPQVAISRGVAQVGGAARRIDAPRMRALTAERPAVRQFVAEYMARLQGELEQSVACNALHRAERRLANWLLRCHDRVAGDVIALTQEYLASMLGSQRTTVNEAAQALQSSGAIRYSRGRVTVLDRGALERAACECYRKFAPVDAAA